MTITNDVMDVVCAVLVNGDASLLVARRPQGKSLGGYWEFPGGKVEPGETLADAMVREMIEEMGTRVVVDSAASAGFTFVDHRVDGLLQTIRLHPMVCSVGHGEPAPVALEHMAIDWISLADNAALEMLDWAPGDRRILAQVLAWNSSVRGAR